MKIEAEFRSFLEGLLEEYACDLFMIMRHDFLRELTGYYIENKAFEDD